ncbi:MAG: ParB N-terminal domain-containing protein [Deinococcus sp.]
MDQPSLFVRPLDTTPVRVSLRDIRPAETSGLIRSVGLVGVLQALLLRPSCDPAFVYEIVDGGRRDHSARHYGLPDVPALVTDGSGAQIAAARAIANTARSSNPVQEARAWHAVMQEGMYPDVQALARDFGVRVVTVRRRLRLMQLPDVLLDAVQGGRIAEGTAEKIANLAEVYRDRALVLYGEVTARGERFTDAHLGEVRTRREGDLTRTVLGALSALPGAQPLLRLPEVEILAGEVRRLAQERGVDLAALVAALEVGAPARLPASAPSSPSVPLVAAPVCPVPQGVGGRVRLGVRG